MDDKKVCGLCGRPITGFGNTRLFDDTKVCPDCVKQVEALPGTQPIFWNMTRQQLSDHVSHMQQLKERRDQLEQLMHDRLAYFSRTRTFDVPKGALIAVDDNHQLVRFVIGALDWWPGLKSVVLAISELVAAQTNGTPSVRVTTNLAGLTNLIIPLSASTGDDWDAIGDFILDGITGVMIGGVRREIRDQSTHQLAYQLAIRAAEFMNDLINPPEQTTPSPADELSKWKSLLDSGGITQDEYDSKKQQLLGLG